MRLINFPLFRKFALAIIIVVIIFGTINVVFLWKNSVKTFNREIDKRMLVVARVLAEKSIEPILYDDVVNLYKGMDAINKADSTIFYIVVYNKYGNVKAFNSCSDKLPSNVKELLISDPPEYNFKSLYSHEGDFVIREIIYPILDGELGYIKIGVKEVNLTNELVRASTNLILMIVGFLIIGLLSALVFSTMISKPIKKIVDFSRHVDFTNFNMNFTKQNLWNKKIFGYYLYDELDMLNEEFSSMYDRLKNSHNELKESQESLMHAEKLTAIGTLTAGLTHEINNPLAGLQYAVKRLQKTTTIDDKGIELLKMMAEAIDRISAVVKDLLDFSRKQEFQIKNVSISKIIDRTLSLVEYDLKKNNIKVIKEYPDSTPTVKGSASHLEQVVLNLLINSIDSINDKEFPEGGCGMINIVLLNQAENISLFVMDNGIGMAEDELKNIFDPFFTKKVTGNGTGLGLSICYKIVKDHGGNISALNNDQGGLTIFIELPTKI